MAENKDPYYAGRKVPITISLPEKLKQQLDELVNLTKYNRSQIIRLFFGRYWEKFYKELKEKWIG